MKLPLSVQGGIYSISSLKISIFFFSLVDDWTTNLFGCCVCKPPSSKILKGVVVEGKPFLLEDGFSASLRSGLFIGVAVNLFPFIWETFRPGFKGAVLASNVTDFVWCVF